MKNLKVALILLTSLMAQKIFAPAMLPDLPINYDASIQIHNKTNQVIIYTLSSQGQSILKLEPKQSSKVYTSNVWKWQKYGLNTNIEKIGLKLQALTDIGLKETYVGKLPAELQTDLKKYVRQNEDLLLTWNLVAEGSNFIVEANLNDRIIKEEELPNLDLEQDTNVLVNVYVNGPNIEDMEIDLTAEQKHLKEAHEYFK